ncbi:hypothetical protein CDAR_579111 [Caerostris darwini]|uniref:Uncharacterized protein n=1 Tax=Caerostris darwini TaxID=1538125 RepID=A0AAV4RUI8_9ARAC|nr:hypothetical protein CDAR_579111 [Caerostris darwini]
MTKQKTTSDTDSKQEAGIQIYLLAARKPKSIPVKYHPENAIKQLKRNKNPVMSDKSNVHPNPGLDGRDYFLANPPSYNPPSYTCMRGRRRGEKNIKLKRLLCHSREHEINVGLVGWR